MIQQTKFDKSKFLSANRNMRQRSPRSVARAIKANPSDSEIKTWAPKLPFAEDFLLEHSLGRHPQVMLMEISGIF